VFITRKGRKVGIFDPSRDNGGEWDFELKDQPLNVLVLLAEEKGYLYDYILPPKFLHQHWKQFERETRDRSQIVRIYVRKIEGVVSIVLTNPLTAVPIEQYEGQKHPGNYSALD
jgi:hypothetical protein